MWISDSIQILGLISIHLIYLSFECLWIKLEIKIQFPRLCVCFWHIFRISVSFSRMNRKLFLFIKIQYPVLLMVFTMSNRSYVHTTVFLVSKNILLVFFLFSLASLYWTIVSIGFSFITIQLIYVFLHLLSSNFSYICFKHDFF